MNHPAIPYLLEPSELDALLPSQNLLVVDVSSRETYLQQHIPSAIHLEYSHLVSGQLPAAGLLPPMERLQSALCNIGFSAEKHIVAYDNQANGNACRLLWTLEAVGYTNASLLNGGLHAWCNQGYSTADAETPPEPQAEPKIVLNPAVIADKDYVLTALGKDEITLLDARTPDEYNGVGSPSLRDGRIPGAVNLNWMDAIDQNNSLRFHSDEKLNAMLTQIGVEHEKEIIVYCQAHRRASHSFVMLRHLGFNTVRGYAGAWAEWGNDPGLPIE